MDPFLGEIRPLPYGWAPREWAPCEGQLLPISRYTALFSILGTAYGGDGRTTFALPDLRGTVPLGSGQGPGLRAYEVGEAEGTGAVTLTEQTVPPHTHTMQGFDSRSGGEPVPGPKMSLATSKPGNAYESAKPAQPAVMDPNSIEPAGGGSLPHENMMPSLAIVYCIALEGIFPQRP
ncbi:MAG: phage tail protein [Solirubrobacteraceae bacterium]